MIAVLKHWQIGVGMVAGALLSFAPVYLYGKSQGREEGAVAALEISVSSLRAKGEINAQVSVSYAADLCSDFGLPNIEQSECVRRVREASAQP